jgi:hypothetical protein
VSKLPPWTGDDAAMQRWLDDKLDELLSEDTKSHSRRGLPLSEEEARVLFPEDSDEGAIAAAERGDIGPLRRRHPEYARLSIKPKRGVGQRGHKDRNEKWKEHPRDSRLALAVIDVGRIRALWQKHFQLKNRSKHQGEKSAEHFAAERWGLTEDEVSDAMRVGRLRPPE